MTILKKVSKHDLKIFHKLCSLPSHLKKERWQTKGCVSVLMLLHLFQKVYIVINLQLICYFFFPTHENNNFRVGS
jgi:hypothetical protein